MELARRALVERSLSWLDELAIWSFEWCNIANIHDEAGSTSARRASSSSQAHRVNGVLVGVIAMFCDSSEARLYENLVSTARESSRKCETRMQEFYENSTEPILTIPA